MCVLAFWAKPVGPVVHQSRLYECRADYTVGEGVLVDGFSSVRFFHSIKGKRKNILVAIPFCLKEIL